MAEGRGDSLGEALVNAIAAEAGGIGHKSTYDRQGWHAQLVQMVEKAPSVGYPAASKAGLSASADTLRAWLAWSGPDSGDREPSAANKAKIQKAYDIAGAKWPAAVERRDVSITGTVQTGQDSRVRGAGNEAPFHISGQAGDWSRMREAWNKGEVDPRKFEEWFISDVIVPDIGDGSDEWEFPGGAGGYAVTI